MNHDIHGGDTPADDFDLWWGAGPTRNEEQHHTNHLGDMSSGIGSSTPAPSAATHGGSSRGGSSRVGSGSLNPTTSTLMGSLWSSGGAPHLEAYGHRHHVHGSQGEDGVHGSSSPPSASSRRAWLPPPGQHHQHSTISTDGAASPSNRIGQAVVGDVAAAAATAATAPSSSSSLSQPTAGMNSSRTGDSSISGNNVDHKLEELAAAITASVLGKLDTGVWEALATGQQQQQQQQQQESSSVSFTSAASEDGRRQTEAAVVAAVAPLRSRLAALEEQTSRLMARSSAGNGDGGDTSRGGRATSGGVGGGVGLGHGGGGGSAAAAEPLLALNALAQRTGTLEGRHKQVQAKVALLDNAFGPKASDWAQTIKAFIQEREATAGGGGRAVAVAVRPTGGGGSCSGSKGGRKPLAIDAPVFSPQSARDISRGCGKGNNAYGGAGAAAGSPVVVAGARRVESAPEILRAAQGGDAAVAGAAVASEAATAGVREGAVDKGCAACAQTRERCSRLEQRLAKSERTLSLLQGRTAAVAATAATAAAATAAADAVKAWEVEEGSRRDAAVEKAVSSDVLGRQQKAMAAGGGGNWASKASLEKLASELRQLSARAKDGEDTLALVDHGLKGVREEMAPLSGSVSVLKRLVETHLREKEQAAELLKGYVTTITREVATITRQYVNGLMAPGVLAAAATIGDDIADRRIQPSASAAAAEPLAVLSAPAPTSVVPVELEDGVG